MNEASYESFHIFYAPGGVNLPLKSKGKANLPLKSKGKPNLQHDVMNQPHQGLQSFGKRWHSHLHPDLEKWQ
jgi:hypothetical protein